MSHLDKQPQDTPFKWCIYNRLQKAEGTKGRLNRKQEAPLRFLRPSHDPLRLWRIPRRKRSDQVTGYEVGKC